MMASFFGGFVIVIIVVYSVKHVRGDLWQNQQQDQKVPPHHSDLGTGEYLCSAPAKQQEAVSKKIAKERSKF